MKRFLSTSAVALILAIPTVVVLGPAGVAPAAAAGVEASGLPACTDTWTATSGGNWNTSSDWSTGLVPGSGSVACIDGSGTFTVTDDTSPTVGSFQLGGGSGVQTLVVSADGGNTSLSLNSASTVLSNGIFTLAPTGNGNAFLNGSGSLTIASGGTLQTYGASGSNVSYLRVPITNQAGGTLAIGPGGPAGTADQDEGTLTSNAGTVTVSSTGSIALNGGSSFTSTGGTIVNSGTYSQGSGTFTESGGTETGNPLGMTGGSLVDSAGTGSFLATGDVTLSGTVPVGQTVTNESTGGNSTLALSGVVTDDGTLVELPTGNGNAFLNGSGSLTIASGGTLQTYGASGSNVSYLRVPITNQAGGTLAIGPGGPAGTADQDEGTLTSNAGTVTVSSTGSIALNGGSSFTSTGGTIVNNGTYSQGSGTFTESGGTETGDPLGMTGGSLVDSAGTGSFLDTGDVTLSGTIPVGQTVTNESSSGNSTLALSGVVTDDGTLVEQPTGNGSAFLNGSGSLTIASGGTLQTYGASNSNVSLLRVPITNQAGGTLAIGTGGPAGTADQDAGTLTTNAGTVQVANGGKLAISGGSTLTNTGVLGVTVNGTAGGIAGPGIALGGTLEVTTVGTPTVGTDFTPITGSTGTFATLAFGASAYGVSYPSGTSVQLVAGTPFTVAPVAISPEDGLATGPVVVADIAHADLAPSGGYSASINWGDGSPTQTASVSVSGSGGSVTAPTHTYTRLGTFTVTVVVSNTDGTSATASQSVAIEPTVMALSKTTFKQGRKLTTKISGYGLDATAVVTVSNPAVTVVSVKVSKATKKKPYPVITLKLSASKTAATGPFSVTITEFGGATTVVNAVTVVAA